MSHDTTSRGPVNPFRIDINDETQIEYWTKCLGVDRDRLKRAVQVVGSGVEAVTHYLNGY